MFHPRMFGVAAAGVLLAGTSPVLTHTQLRLDVHDSASAHAQEPVHVAHPADTAVCPLYPLDPDAVGLDLEVLVAFEGYSDTLYQPSDRSGPTIGVGLDLGHAAPGTVDYVLRGVVSGPQLRDLLTAQGLTGAAARRWIQQRRHVRLDPCMKRLIESRQFAHYWRWALQQDPGLARAPSTVKTAVTSFLMHTGNMNPLRAALDARDYPQLAEALRTQDWSGPESTLFRGRRQSEADLVMLRADSSRIDYD